MTIVYTYLGVHLRYPLLDEVNQLLVMSFVVVGLLTVLYTFPARDLRLTCKTAVHVVAGVFAALAGDFFTLLVGLELLTFSAYFLLVHRADSERAAVGYRYIGFHISAAALFFVGMAIQYSDTGSLQLARAVPSAAPYFVAAFAIKAVFFPLHIWLVDAYPRAPVFAVPALSVFTTKMGVYAIARIAGGPLVAYIGGATAILGVLGALRQSNARRLLSYHIVSQVGYMVAGAALATQAGIAAGMFHAVNNIVYKTLLFMVAGAVFFTVGHDDLTRLGGLVRRMPVTFAGSVVGSAAIAGVPLFAGYASKELLKSATGYTPLTYMLLVAALGTALSFLKFTFYMFVGERGPVQPESGPTDERTAGNHAPPEAEAGADAEAGSGRGGWGRRNCARGRSEAPWTMLAPIGVLSALSILFGVRPQLAVPGTTYGIYSLSSLWVSVLPLLAALVVWTFARRLVRPHEHHESDLLVEMRTIGRRGLRALERALAFSHQHPFQVYLFLVTLCFVALAAIAL